MQKVLHITNGDNTVDVMIKANISGDFLPWRDVLHDGPVPNDLALESLSNIRAQFIIDRGWGAATDVRQSFAQRDAQLQCYSEYDKVILWFEHDLYDQLQILQILDWINQNKSPTVELSIICTDQYLGRLTPNEVNNIIQQETSITEDHLSLSSKAWSAFRSNTPEKWYQLLHVDTAALPFLKDAVVRLLEEYPSKKYGLSRTAEQALRIISEGTTHASKIFSENQHLEERIFMGDNSFWVILNELLTSQPPLIQITQEKTFTAASAEPPTPETQLINITAAGQAVLAGTLNGLTISTIDRWVGGVHLKAGNIWCWDRTTQSIVKTRE